ncbi:MAG TPA: extensin family protein [Hyphomicrobiaceae bacterium]|nr:extensin family protein [Hyphomicrobiaceae bacterium]
MPPVSIVRTVVAPVRGPEDAAVTSSGSVEAPPHSILQIVAQRARARRQGAERKPQSGALGKGPADAAQGKAPAPAAADPKAAAVPSTSVATPAAPPVPDVWPDAEIIAALRDCLLRLAPLGAEVELADPIKEERCGTPAPVVLKRLTTGAGRVELQPPPTLNCAMVSRLHAWVEKTLQPAAQEMLGSPVVRIRSLSGYVCRNRVGTRSHADRLSEHALANAIDIAGFVTADGRTVDVLSRWGPTLRELREQQERAREAAEAAKASAKQAESEAAEAARAALKAARGAKRAQATAEAARKKEEAVRKRQAASEKEAEWRRTLALTPARQKSDRGPTRGPNRDDDAKPVPVLHSGNGKDDARKTTEAAFLRRLHKGACGTFGTVLGPEANEAHRNHFHLDLIARKRSAFCE